MGVLDRFRNSPGGRNIRGLLKEDAFAIIRNGSGNAIEAYGNLMRIFRTEVQDRCSEVDIHRSQAREYFTLTFYYGATTHLVNEYVSLRSVHQNGLFALYLIANAGLNQEQAIDIASKIAETSSKFNDVEGEGMVAMWKWLEGDLDAAADSLRNTIRLADDSGL